MTAFLVDTADLQKHTSVEIEKAVGNYKAAVLKAQKGKEVTESQFAVLESEKMTLNIALEEAKATRDEAISMIDSLKSEQERLVRVAKEKAVEQVSMALSERDEAIKAL